PAGEEWDPECVEVALIHVRTVDRDRPVVGRFVPGDEQREAVVVEREGQPVRERYRLDLRQRLESSHTLLQESSAALTVVAVHLEREREIRGAVPIVA